MFITFYAASENVTFIEGTVSGSATFEYDAKVTYNVSFMTNNLLKKWITLPPARTAEESLKKKFKDLQEQFEGKKVPLHGVVGNEGKSLPM